MLSAVWSAPMVREFELNTPLLKTTASPSAPVVSISSNKILFGTSLPSDAVERDNRYFPSLSLPKTAPLFKNSGFLALIVTTNLLVG